MPNARPPHRRSSARSGRRLACFARAVALLAGTGLACREEEAPLPPGSLAVLWIGNSLTDGNDLPAMVAGLGEAAGGPVIVTEQVTAGGASLEDHWNGGVAASRIRARAWTHVVLQQGPSSLLSSRENLLEYVARFAAPIRAAGAVPTIYMVWPETARFAVFDAVSTSYRMAAASVDGLLVPGGDAWRAVWAVDPRAALYGDDGFHPSPLGTYVVAVAAWSRLTGRSPVGLPSTFMVRPRDRPAWRLTIPEATAGMVQAAVGGMAAGASR